MKRKRLHIKLLIFLGTLILANSVLISYVLAASPRISPLESSLEGNEHLESNGGQDVTGGESEEWINSEETSTQEEEYEAEQDAESMWISDASEGNTLSSPDTSPRVKRQMPLSKTTVIPMDLFVRLPMEDQFHSQLTETNLPNACGPTALLMILDYLSIEDSLAELIANLSIPPEEGGYDAYCSRNVICTSPGALARMARENYGLSVEAREEWTFMEIYISLFNGHPVIADIVWRGTNAGLGHFVVIYGIDLAEKKIYYHDPYDGPNKVASWEQFAASWDGPVDPGDPLQPEGHRYWGMAVYAE